MISLLSLTRILAILSFYASKKLVCQGFVAVSRSTSWNSAGRNNINKNALKFGLSEFSIDTVRSSTEQLVVEFKDSLIMPSVEPFVNSIVKQMQQLVSSLDTQLSGPLSSRNFIIQKTQQLFESSPLPKAADLLFSSLEETIGPVYAPFQAFANEKLTLLQNLPTLGPLGDALLFVVFTTIVYLSTGGSRSTPLTSPYPMMKYDPYTSKLYFDSRPFETIGRAFYITSQSANFLLNIALDVFRSTLEQNADLRASQLTELLTRLGPSFIKIGQSLSIRTDLLSPAYVRGLKTLQDQVPPFDTSKARKIIEEELGLPVDTVFSDFSSVPIAAASLGQVYKAKIRSTGEDVAVKVQRPGVLNQIALDMHLIRDIAPFLRRTFNLNTDLVDVVDKWGYGFVDELDYQQEGRNSIEFMEFIQKTPLSGVVVAPDFLQDYSAGKILVTKWIDGERLDRCTKSDVTALCSIAMNSYLTMMLEMGILHADPHPGNLLRTDDGKLCILDWGMVTRLNPNLQTTLVEHIAHLVSADYEEVPKDLLLLGFISEDKASAIEDSGIVEVLADIYGAWTKGGGATKINVPKVVSQLQDLQATKGNLFLIPSYFAYIAKSFSVLEGIGLSNDSNYSIIKECLPYVSQRLLTDGKLSGSALNIFLFGPDKYNADRLLNYNRVEDLVEGFAEYSSSASGALLSTNESLSRRQLIENQADQILDLLLLEEEETPLQTIFFEQLAKIISSSSRSIWSVLRRRSGTLPSGRTVLGTIVDPLGLWRTSPLVRVNELDEKTIQTTRNLIISIPKSEKKNKTFSTNFLILAWNFLEGTGK